MKFSIFELGIFSFNSYVYYLSRGFITSTGAFNLLTRAFNLPTRAFSLLTCGFELITLGFELVTRGFELVTGGFELATRVLLFRTYFTLKLYLDMKKSYYQDCFIFEISNN